MIIYDDDYYASYCMYVDDYDCFCYRYYYCYCACCCHYFSFRIPRWKGGRAAPTSE